MVTKRALTPISVVRGSVLAKIQMVTKPNVDWELINERSVLAKIQMVTKQTDDRAERSTSSVLAKIQMVTKPQKYISIFLNLFKTMIVT